MKNQKSLYVKKEDLKVSDPQKYLSKKKDKYFFCFENCSEASLPKRHDYMKKVIQTLKKLHTKEGASANNSHRVNDVFTIDIPYKGRGDYRIHYNYLSGQRNIIEIKKLYTNETH